MVALSDMSSIPAQDRPTLAFSHSQLASQVPSSQTRFPESFQRSMLMHDDDECCSTDLPASPSPYPYSPSPSLADWNERRSRSRSRSPPLRFRRNSVMRLENILNDISFSYTPVGARSRSLDARPAASATTDDSPSTPLELDRIEAEPIGASYSTPSFPSPDTPASAGPLDSSRPLKKKKVKMHYCPECNKGFPRPSGLRTHMNMHTKEKPFPCSYPGCNRSFSVVSNAKRHMKTHGPQGGNISSNEGGGPIPEQYIVGFEEPVVLQAPSIKSSDDPLPMRLRWVSPSDKGKGVSREGDTGAMDPSPGHGGLGSSSGMVLPFPSGP